MEAVGKHFQSGYSDRTFYYLATEYHRGGWVKVIGIGTLYHEEGQPRRWMHAIDGDKYTCPYPLCKMPRIARHYMAKGGEGRIEGGIVLVSSHCGGEDGNEYTIAECELPDEADD
jgi:hypothetical protein